MARKTLKYILIATVSLALGFVIQINQKDIKNNIRMSCSDGSGVKDRLSSVQKWSIGSLIEFGELARSAWKKCACTDFAGSVCAALEAEMSDETQLSQLNGI